MAFHAQAFEVLIASPGDLAEERDVVERAITRWSDVHGGRSVLVRPVRWEKHAVSEVGSTPQDILNRQIVDRCDLVIGMFWTRLGTPTDRAESGAVEEIERFTASGRPAVLLFSNRPVPPKKFDADQHKRLQSFRKRMRPKSLSFEFETQEQLAELVDRHLAAVLGGLARAADSRQRELPEAPFPTRYDPVLALCVEEGMRA